MVILLVMIQELYCTNACEYTNIPSCRGELVFDLSRLQVGIFVYTLVKLYNKANLVNNISKYMQQTTRDVIFKCSLFF